MPSGVPLEDMTGKKFGYLTLTKRVVEKYFGKTRVYWICKCVCGKTTKTRQDGILNSKVYSCGCKNPLHGKLYGPNHPAWKGCGEIQASHLSQIKNKAKKLGREFSVTLEELWELFLKQDRKCALTGLPLQFQISRRRQEQDQTASLDRINSDLGYTIDNVQWVHKYANIMKKDFPQDIYLAICNAVANKNPKSTKEIKSILSGGINLQSHTNHAPE